MAGTFSTQRPELVCNPDGTVIGSLQIVSTTTTVTQVGSLGTVVTLQASNLNRIGLSIYNDSTSVLYVKRGSAASLTSFSFALGPKDANGVGDYWEMGEGFVYTGIVTGIWASANGFAYVTEDS